MALSSPMYEPAGVMQMSNESRHRRGRPRPVRLYLLGWIAEEGQRVARGGEKRNPVGFVVCMSTVGIG